MESKFSQFLGTYPMHIYGKGQVVLRPEHEEYHIYFVSSGFVRAHTITEEGNEFSAVLLGQSMYFPIFRYLSDGLYTKKLSTKYYYSTITETKIVTLSSTDLINFLASNPQTAIELSDIYYLTMKLLLSKLEFIIFFLQNILMRKKSENLFQICNNQYFMFQVQNQWLMQSEKCSKKWELQKIT